MDLDEAYEQCRGVLAKWVGVASAAKKPLTEADTRAKLIDPIFRDALGWTEESIVREEPNAEGFADYTLWSDNRRILLIEAKRAAPLFDLPDVPPNKPLLVGGASLAAAPVQSAIRQAAGYGAALGCPYALITNGSQFLAVASLDNRALPERQALVFSQLEAKRTFRAFFELFEASRVRGGSISERFLSFYETKRTYVALQYLQQPDHELRRNRLWSILSHLATRVLEDRPETRNEIINHCYVATTESTETDKILRQLVKRDPPSLLRQAGASTVRLGERKRSHFGVSLEAAVKDRKAGVYVLSGGAGSGKTTFLSRFESIVDPGLVEKFCAWFHVDFLPAGRPDVATVGREVAAFVFAQVRRQIGSRYAHEITVDGAALRELFADEIGVLETTELYQVDANAPKRQKVINREVKRLFEDDEAFVAAAIRRLIRLGRRPVFVLDNSDQLGEEFQERVFLQAKSLQDTFSAICIVSLREEKFYAAYYRGVFNAFPTQKFYIGNPLLKDVLRRRLAYGLELMRQEPASFFGEGDTSVDALSPEDCKTLLNVFIRSVVDQNRNIVRMLESVSMGNTRFGLELFRDFVGSGNTNVDKILTAERREAGYIVPFHEFAKSVMLQNREFYRAGSSAITNLYARSTAPKSSHFTYLRILIYLEGRLPAPSEHGAGFVEATTLRREFASAMALGTDYDECLAHLISKGLVESEPPRTTDMSALEAIKLGAAGAYYLRFLVRSFAYIDLVAYEIPFSHDVLPRYLAVHHGPDISIRLERVGRVLGYLLDEEAEELARTPSESVLASPVMPSIVDQLHSEMAIIAHKNGVTWTPPTAQQGTTVRPKPRRRRHRKPPRRR